MLNRWRVKPGKRLFPKRGYEMNISNMSHTTAVQASTGTRVHGQPPTGAAPFEDPKAANTPAPNNAVANPEQTLTRNELRLIEELKQIDLEVRQHEMAHVAAGAGLVTSGATFSYQKGPDGKDYAVAGEVQIDVSPVPGDPQATLRKMEQVKAAALAPASPSAQDQKVAANAGAQAMKAQAELAILRANQDTKNPPLSASPPMERTQSYIRVGNLPEEEITKFQIIA